MLGNQGSPRQLVGLGDIHLGVTESETDMHTRQARPAGSIQTLMQGRGVRHWGLRQLQRGASICRWLLPLLELQESLWIRQGSVPRINSLQADKRLDVLLGVGHRPGQSRNPAL